MKQILSFIILLLFIPVVCFSETVLDTSENNENSIILFSDDQLILLYDSIEIHGKELRINCIVENNSDFDLKIKLTRCILNGWDIIDNSVFDGYLFVKSHSKKRTSLNFDKGSYMAGISTPDEAYSLDYALHITHEGQSTIYYDSPEPVIISLITTEK